MRSSVDIVNGPDAPVTAGAAPALARSPRQPSAGAEPASRAPWVGAEPPIERVLATAVTVMLVVAFAEIAIADSVGVLVGLGLVVVSVGAALTVRPRDLFTAGVLPPLLLVAVLTVVAVLHGEGIQVARLDSSAGVAQRVIAGFVHLAGALVVAHAAALTVVALRGRLHRRDRRGPAAIT